MIVPIFSVPIYNSNLEFDFDPELLDNLEYQSMQTEGRWVSKNKYILNDPIFSSIKTEVEKHLEHFVRNGLFINKKNKFYLTTSWVIKTEPNGWATKHIHANSLLSGVVYLKTNHNTGDIVFHKENRYSNLFYPTLIIDFDKWNEFNSSDWRFSTHDKQILIFPSNLEHSVNVNLTNEYRYSLAFNVFVKGQLGEHLAEINL